MFSWVLALRYLQRRWVNVLGTVGVMVAVWSLIVVRGVFSGFIEDIRADVRRSAPDLLVTTLPAGTSFEQLEQVLQAQDGVVATAPRLRHYGTFFLRTSSSALQSVELEFSNVDNSFVQMLGIDPERERQVTPFDEWLARGRRRTPRNSGELGAPDLGPQLEVPARMEWFARRRLGLPVPKDAAEWRPLWAGMLLGSPRVRYQHGLDLGVPMDLLAVDYASRAPGQPARAITLQRTFAFAGAFQSGARLFDESVAIVPIEPLRTMLGHDALDADSIDLCTDVAIRATPGLDEAALRALAARLLPLVQKALPPGNTAEVLTWEQQNQVFLEAVETERAMTTLVLFAVMLIAAFLIFATLHMMVTQKTKDIGILTALGGSPSGIGQIFTRCGFVIGLVGTSCGLLLGLLTLWNFDAINDWLYESFRFELFPRALFDVPKVPRRIEPPWLAAVCCGAFSLTLFVSWLPARAASRMPPVKALAYE